MSATPAQLRRLRSIGNKIDAAQNVVVMSHGAPDADTVGTALGLAEILKARGKTVTVLVPTPAMTMLHAIPGWNDVVFDQAEARRRVGAADMVIAVDTTGLGRFGNNRWVFHEAKKRGITTVNLDHHDTNDNFADLNYVEPDAPAAGVVVTRLAKTMKWDIPPRAATDLYTAICSDTGVFMGRAATWEAFSFAAQLLQDGADRGAVSKIFGKPRLSLAEAKLVGAALQEVTLNANGVAYVGVSTEMLQKAGLGAQDSKIVLWRLQELVGWRVMIVMTEKPNNQFAVSVRTRGSVSAEAIATAFGGGGHFNAAGIGMSGGTLQANLDKVVRRADAVVTGRAVEGPGSQLAA